MGDKKLKIKLLPNGEIVMQTHGVTQLSQEYYETETEIRQDENIEVRNDY